MKERQREYDDSTAVLSGRAVRIPITDEADERRFYETVTAMAEARERKAALLADPDVPLSAACDAAVDRLADGFERRLQSLTGDDYPSIGAAYHRGERDDPLSAVVTYYSEGLWRIQQYQTIEEGLFFPLVLRYPNSFTVNVRFATGYATAESVYYESPEHATVPDDEYAERYYAESQYSQERAAEYIRDSARVIRETFPDPAETPPAERESGGIVAAVGRRRSVCSDALVVVDPDPDRFDDTVSVPTLVPEGPEAVRTARELLPDGESVA